MNQPTDSHHRRNYGARFRARQITGKKKGPIGPKTFPMVSANSFAAYGDCLSGKLGIDWHGRRAWAQSARSNHFPWSFQ